MENTEGHTEKLSEAQRGAHRAPLQAVPMDQDLEHTSTPKKRVENRGGARKGGGRPTRKVEGNITAIFNQAMKGVYKKHCSTEAKIEFAKKLLTFERGQIFVAEHIFGKAVQRTDVTTGGESLIIPILNNDSLSDPTPTPKEEAPQNLSETLEQ